MHNPQEEYLYMDVRKEILENTKIRNLTYSDYSEYLCILQKMAEYELKHNL